VNPKLYVLVRADLPPGPRAVQACHAALQFAHDHDLVFRDWVRLSNYLIIKEAPDESALRSVVELARVRGHKHTLWTEPDLGDSLTAIAVEPAGRRLFGRYPLALSGLEVGKPAA
jgi:hypothetical protein